MQIACLDLYLELLIDLQIPVCYQEKEVRDFPMN